MKTLNWKYISIITQEEDIFTLVSFIIEPENSTYIVL